MEVPLIVVFSAYGKVEQRTANIGYNARLHISLFYYNTVYSTDAIRE